MKAWLCVTGENLSALIFLGLYSSPKPHGHMNPCAGAWATDGFARTLEACVQAINNHISVKLKNL